MLIDRTHKGWIKFTVGMLLVATGLYAWYRHHSFTVPGGNGPTGSSWPGIAYGAVGLLLMTFCGLLGARRKVRVWRLGRAETWLRAHIWLGLLAFPLILFHSGMRWGNGLSLWLMILFGIVIVSGIIGVFLQNLLPRTMLQRIQAETTYEQIPQVVELLRKEADTLVSNVCGPLGTEAPAPEEPSPVVAHGVKKEGAVQGKVVKAKGKSTGPVEGSGPLRNFYLSEVQPYLSARQPQYSRLATERSAIALFEHTRTLLPETLHDTLKDLASVCEERRQLALQVRLHFWLHSWEFVHVPLSYALLALSVLHAIVATLKY